MVAVQPSQNGGDSKLVLLFNEVIVKGQPPILVKVTIQGLRAPPIPGPDKTGIGESEPNYTTHADIGGFSWGYGPQREGIKDTSVPGVSLDSSVKDPNSGTITSKGTNTKLPLWTQIRIAIVYLPPNAVIH